MRQIIENMLCEIQLHKRDKDTLLQFYVKERLDKGIQSYYSQLLDSYRILYDYDNEVKIIKKLNK